MSDNVTIPSLEAHEEVLRARNFQRSIAAAPKPVVTYALIAVNSLIFLAMTFTASSFLSLDNQEMLKWGADFGPLTLGGQWWRLITSCFLHFNFIHIAMNMFILFQVGVFTEKLFGNVRFALLYLLAGVGGNIVSLYGHSGHAVTSAGASGAVFGVYGGLLAFLLMQRGVVPSNLSMGIAKSAGIFIVYNIVYGLSSPTTDLLAHGGGLAAGFLVGCALAMPLSPEGQRLYPMRTLIVALCGTAVTYGAMMLLPHPDRSESRLYEKLILSNRLKVANDDYVYYSGSATKADAESLGKALATAEFFVKPNGIVLLSKGSDGTVVSILTGADDHSRPVKDPVTGPAATHQEARLTPDPWDDPEYLASIETTGVMIAPSVGGPPIKIALLSEQGDVEKLIPIVARAVTIGTKDSVWYSGTATQQEAEALGKALQDNGFFFDQGARVVLSKGAAGTDVSFMVKEGVWDDPTMLPAFQQIGRKIAGAVGGTPLTVHLVDKTMANKKDIVVK